MSSIPTRRTTRVTRASALKDNENATARPGRTAPRAKPPSSSSTNTAGTTRATGATAASRAKASASTKLKENGDAAAQKRKREALAEVGGPNKPKPASTKESATKGKAVFDGVVLKKTATTSQTTVAPPSTGTARTALRTLSGHAPASRRTTRAAAASAITVATDHAVVKREVLAEIVEEMEVDMHPSTSKARLSSLRATNERRASLRAAAAAKAEADEEDLRAYKKRRTSSEAGDEELRETEAQLTENVAEEAEEVAGEVEDWDQGWDDLDAEDADDPQMVSEYVAEIFAYLKEVEQKTMPSPHYMDSQKELAWKMRGILTDWLIQVHFRFRLLPETLFLAVNIIDRFLSARVVSLQKLQLVGIVCMFIAAKVEEVVAPSASNFLYCADSTYTENEILQAEKYILKTIDWDLSYPNPMHFLRRISKADNYDVQARTVGKYLLEISCLEWRLLPAPPSLLAAASIWLARLILGREEWTPNLAHYSSYPEEALIPTANIMLNYILKPVVHESFFKKYASRKYMKASDFVRKWAVGQWGEGAKVDLYADLPALREMARETREELAIAEAHARTAELLGEADD